MRRKSSSASATRTARARGNLERALAARDGLGEPQIQFCADVTASISIARVRLRPTSEFLAELSTEHLLEEIRKPAGAAECCFELLARHRALAGLGSEFLTVFPILPESIVLAARLRVGQHFIGFADLLELGFRLIALIALVAIGMPLQGQLAIGLLYSALVSFSSNTENFVIVLEFHAGLAWDRFWCLFIRISSMSRCGTGV